MPLFFHSILFSSRQLVSAMNTSSTARRLTRSQTSSTVLGKRTASLSRSSSVASNKSVDLLTPEATPNPKRVRTSVEDVDGRANKENIPPLRNLQLVSPPTSRLSRRSSFSSDASTSSSRSRNLRRHPTQSAIPQTPSRVPEISLATPPSTPPLTLPLHHRVRSLLRTTSNSSNNMSLEGRETERSIIESFLHSFDGDMDISESVLYVSGSPGTGKTALVNSIIASAKISDNVRVIFLNCMAISGLDALWPRLADELLNVSAPKAGKRGVGKKLHGKDEVCAILEKQRYLKCVIVLDELDNLSGSSSNALQPLFSLAASYPSTIRIMGIANTHTLTSTSSVIPFSIDAVEETASGSLSKLKSKKSVKIKTIHFTPYTSSQLLAILNKRFESLPQDELRKMLPQTALVLLTKKVSALTGDVRVLFEALRGAIDLAAPAPLSSPSEMPPPMSIDFQKPISVSPAHILSALKSCAPSMPSKAKTGGSSTSSNSETVIKVRNLGLQARLVLLALVLASRRVTATLPLSTTSSSPTKALSSPTKRSPIKRTSSSSSTSSGSSDTHASRVDCMQLHAYYTSLLTVTDTFTPVSRSDFTDLLGVLETTGLVTLAAPTGRALNRVSSFIAKMKSSGGAQAVGLQGHVREGEVVRGLGIGAEAAGEGVVLEDDVRTIWAHEMGRIRREAKAKNASAALESIVGFEDAIED
ncbi:hypothetical protein EW145_g7808 [Phellinidium pouzarii]|uniref:AAA+ ATPase domain-containing protein n=1 Tax=Phellinidium pouzarii TaxID=167371 RepID=A0A4S4KEW0_9AGAM|nr:hypothetical protein EW145_g7808 [Phellinidium pouzarii]